jgi:hypothetical protein
MIMRLIYMFIALVYSVGVTGMHVNLHWCSGELASMNINTISDGACGCDDEDEADSCCADSELYFKVDNTHAGSSGIALPAFASYSVPETPIHIRTNFFVDYKNAFQFLRQDFLPPPDILKINCCFLI